ncbi:hypothetical protein Csa_017673 [Cucumis sativus]|uniref:Uncharacterized protein n=1 Tax=Cucumis sativus TaxID=3659 RepID=A0A0A0LVU7_CUCSA|nr:hypothetical protein Csa_017673 [Cucumis sativus]
MPDGYVVWRPREPPRASRVRQQGRLCHDIALMKGFVRMFEVCFAANECPRHLRIVDKVENNCH